MKMGKWLYGAFKGHQKWVICEDGCISSNQNTGKNSRWIHNHNTHVDTLDIALTAVLGCLFSDRFGSTKFLNMPDVLEHTRLGRRTGTNVIIEVRGKKVLHFPRIPHVYPIHIHGSSEFVPAS